MLLKFAVQWRAGRDNIQEGFFPPAVAAVEDLVGSSAVCGDDFCEEGWMAVNGVCRRSGSSLSRGWSQPQVLSSQKEWALQLLTLNFAIADYCLSPERPKSSECEHVRLTKCKQAELSFADVESGVSEGRVSKGTLMHTLPCPDASDQHSSATPGFDTWFFLDELSGFSQILIIKRRGNHTRKNAKLVMKDSTFGSFKNNYFL